MYVRNVMVNCLLQCGCIHPEHLPGLIMFENYDRHGTDHTHAVVGYLTFTTVAVP